MNDYPEELKRQEHAAIDKRNEKLNRDKERNPVGVALSGGGIRSATQSLGAFQALQDNGLDKEIDYMSTVSGGGYFGAFWGRCWKEGDTDLSMENRKIIAVTKAILLAGDFRTIFVLIGCPQLAKSFKSSDAR